MLRKLVGGLGSFALIASMAACAEPSGAPSAETTTAISGPSSTTGSPTHPSTSSPRTPSPDVAPSPTSQTITSASTLSCASTPASDVIPGSLRGDWAHVDEGDGDSVSGGKCDPQTAPRGLITVEATGIRYFETFAKLESVEKSDAHGLTGQFSIRYADTLSDIGIELEGRNNGQTLITTDFTETTGLSHCATCAARSELMLSHIRGMLGRNPEALPISMQAGPIVQHELSKQGE